jgi:hypothetical protein
VCRTLVAQPVEQPRRRGDGRLAGGHFAVEQAQRIGLQAPLTVATQLRGQGPVIGPQGFEIGRPTLGVADTVQLQRQLAQPEPAVEAPEQRNHLRVDQGVDLADRLTIPLVKLAVTAPLGPVVAEAVDEAV